jgi:glycyl-tRNA synthetase (class II)
MGDEKKPKPMALGAAVAQGIIANETLAYFIGRTWLFFCRVGVDPTRMRFRQHLQHEVMSRHRAAGRAGGLFDDDVGFYGCWLVGFVAVGCVVLF